MMLFEDVQIIHLDSKQAFQYGISNIFQLGS